jgi:RsiW-degrading membrane proteinase PrsW (M82 family)
LATTAETAVFLTILVVVAFVPSLLYLIWIRNTERYQREPYGRLLWIFIYGAVASVLIAIIIEDLLVSVLNLNLERIYQIFGENPDITTLLLALVIAPFVEEAAKSLGVFSSRRRMRDIEDGIIYGAAAGLGFAATENLIYEGSAFLTAGTEALITIAVVRTLSSALLHATSSSVFGLGIARSTWQGRRLLPYYLGAVAIHSVFNFAASFGVIYAGTIGDGAYLIGLVAALALAIGGISIMRIKIRALDRPG